MKRVIAAGAVLAVAAGSWCLWASAPAEGEPPLLKEGVATEGTIRLEESPLAPFRVKVPHDAILMKVHVTKTPVIVDILARKDEPIEAPPDAENQTHAETLETTLLVSRQSMPPLEEGTYYLAVAYLGSGPPVVHKRPVKEIPFEIKVSFVRASVAEVLRPGEKTAAQLSAEEGSQRIFAVDVPAEAKVLRIDLDEVSSDLDLLARRGEPVLAADDAEQAAMSPLGRESLVIDGSSQPPLKPGRWYISVVHPLDSGTADFSLYASFASKPPPALLAIPEIPCPDDARKRAIQATVDVTTDHGGASGTLVTADGLVLTNHHVVAEVAENPPEQDPVVIGITFDPRQPTRELFRGRVLRFDKRIDLALVRITTGFYHQPLPEGYRFPVIPLGNPALPEIGDAVSVLGFPMVGGSIGRVSLTLTRGVISGFERTPIGTIIKTDALIGPGNSGGAALDGQYRLIGVPTYENVSPEAVSRMSYIHPIALLPEEWKSLFVSQPKPRR